MRYFLQGVILDAEIRTPPRHGAIAGAQVRERYDLANMRWKQGLALYGPPERGISTPIGKLDDIARSPDKVFARWEITELEAEWFRGLGGARKTSRIYVRPNLAGWKVRHDAAGDCYVVSGDVISMLVTAGHDTGSLTLAEE